MNYIEYKKLGQDVLKSKEPMSYWLYFQYLSPSIDEQIHSYKYHHCDLTKEEHKKLCKLNGLNEDDVLIGGEVHRVVGDVETKQLMLKKADEIDLFLIMDQIQWIIKQRENV